MTEAQNALLVEASEPLAGYGQKRKWEDKSCFKSSLILRFTPVISGTTSDLPSLLGTGLEAYFQKEAHWPAKSPAKKHWAELGAFESKGTKEAVAEQSASISSCFWDANS